MSTIVPPTSITAWPGGLPDVTAPDFRQRALVWVNHLTNVAAAEFSALAANVHRNAQGAYAQAQAASAQRALADAAATLAAQHAASASAVSGAVSWTAGQTWALGAIVWGVTQPGTVYRCIQAHSGSSAPPEQDGAHWVAVGARSTASPTAGPSETTLTYGADGALQSVSFRLDGKAGSVTLTRADGRVTQVVTQHDGRRRTDSLTYSGGQLARVDSSEEIV